MHVITRDLDVAQPGPGTAARPDQPRHDPGDDEGNQYRQEHPHHRPEGKVSQNQFIGHHLRENAPGNHVVGGTPAGSPIALGDPLGARGEAPVPTDRDYPNRRRKGAAHDPPTHDQDMRTGRGGADLDQVDG
jgi:hypothetical protein